MSTRQPGRVRRTPQPVRTPAAATSAADDGALALRLFNKLFALVSFATWRVVIKALFGLPLTEAEDATLSRLTGRTKAPDAPVRECWVVAGRRSGKSRIAAFCVVYLAAVRRWRTAPGERPMVLLIAPSRRQAGVVLSYAVAMLDALPGVTIIRNTVDEIELSTGVTVRIESASFRTPRGFTIVGVVADEVAYWRDESGASPDVEILRAVRPPLASVPGSLLIAISSPYAARGALHAMYERHFGRDNSDVLVVQADSRTLNPTLPAKLVEQAFDEDPSAAAAEWGGQFRSDLESMFPRDVLTAVLVPKRFELPNMLGTVHTGFFDAAGGSGSDSMTGGIARRDPSGKSVLVLLREFRPPFSPEEVCKALAADFKRYACRAVFSDAYAGDWPKEQFSKLGITVQPSPLTRSELYLELLPMINSGGCELLDNSRLINQLAALERRTGRTGRDAVDHPRGSHDDLANAAAGALVMASRSIGLKAALPSDFDRCVNDAAGGRCAFLFNGAWFPSDGHCRRHCSGLKAVLGSYREACNAAEAAGEPQPTARAFLDERFDLESSPLTRNAAWRDLARISPTCTASECAEKAGVY